MLQVPILQKTCKWVSTMHQLLSVQTDEKRSSFFHHVILMITYVVETSVQAF